jgi:hypothetical protein
MKKTGPRLKTPAARMRVAREMIVRTIKNLLRRAMRDVIIRGGGIAQLTEVAVATFNCVTGATDIADMEVYWDSVRDGARGRFGANNLDKFLHIGTNDKLCRASPGKIVLRVAADVGIELTTTCATDLQDLSGERFAFNPTDISRLVPRIKCLDIINKAEGMALAGQLDDASLIKQSDIGNAYARLRLLDQAASKLRIAARGVFPDEEVASKLTKIRLEQARLETNPEILLAVAAAAFEEIVSFPYDWSPRVAVDLAEVLLDNTEFAQWFAHPRWGRDAEGKMENIDEFKACLSGQFLYEQCKQHNRLEVFIGDYFYTDELHPLIEKLWADLTVVNNESRCDARRLFKILVPHLKDRRQREQTFGLADDATIPVSWCGDEGDACLAKTRDWIQKESAISKSGVVKTLKEFAICVGLSGGADGEIREGVEFDMEGQITEISWGFKGLNGKLDDFQNLRAKMPKLRVLELYRNPSLTGTVCFN